MPVVEAQTLFAADAPQHAPARRQWRRAAEMTGEALVNGQTGGRGAAEAQLRAWGARCRGSVGRGARRRAARRACVCVCVRPRQGTRRHTSWCLLALSTAVAVLQKTSADAVTAISRELSGKRAFETVCVANAACGSPQITVSSPRYLPSIAKTARLVSLDSSVGLLLLIMATTASALASVEVLEPIQKTIQRGGSVGDLSPSSTMHELPKPHATPAPARITCASGDNHTLSICDGKVLACGGSSLYEEGETFVAHLGLGEDREWGEPVSTPQPVACAGQAVEVGCGALHSLILCADGALLSFGGGWEGVLGHGDEASLSVPRPIAGLSDVRRQPQLYP